MEGYGTYMAQVVDISIETSGKVKLHRVFCAADCGQQVNPDTVVAQIESSILFGLTSALMWGEINLQDGPRAADQLRQLSRGAHERSAAHRCLPGRQQRGARRHRRAGNRTGGSGWSVMPFLGLRGVGFARCRCLAIAVVLASEGAHSPGGGEGLLQPRASRNGPLSRPGM